MKALMLGRLRQGHRQITRLLGVVERQFHSIGRAGRPDYALMYQILHYLTYYPDRYHHAFEELLFGCLAARRPDMQSTLALLHDQHDRLTCQGIALRCALDEILNDGVLSRADLMQDGQAYVDHYHEHLAYETTAIFPRLADSLTASDWVAMTTRFEWQPDPLSADAIGREYDLLAERLRLMGVDLQTLTGDHETTCPACSDDTPVLTAS